MQTVKQTQRFWRDAHSGLAPAIHVTGTVFHVAAPTQPGVGQPRGPMRSSI